MLARLRIAEKPISAPCAALFRCELPCVRFTFISLILLCVIGTSPADTIRVTVGDTGCPGRQIGVTESWKKIPDVVSVTVLPRQPKEPAAQRVFVIVSKAAPPTEDSLREALGRRAKHYPILRYEGEPRS
jgi:hypothetical protein